jgi:hypothetical protein
MAENKRTKVEDGFDDSVHDFSTGDLSGTYTGSELIQTRFGEKMKHTFDTADGSKVIFGKAMLTRLLSKVAPGTKVDVVETGRTIKLDNGGSLKEYEVYTLEA